MTIIRNGFLKMMMLKLIKRFLDYICGTGLSELDKYESVKVHPLHNICYHGCTSPGTFVLWLDGDGYGVRYWYYKGKYINQFNDRTYKYPKELSQSDIRPYFIKWKLENCKHNENENW